MLSFLPLVLISLLSVVQADSRVTLGRCRFGIDGRKFNLCPVLDLLQADLIVDVPPTDGVSRSYRWGVTRDAGLSNRTQCPKSTLLCLTEIYPSYTIETPIIETKALTSLYTNDGGFVVAWRSEDGSPLHVKLKLECGPETDSSSRPSFVSALEGVHAFSLITKHACGEPLSVLYAANANSTHSRLGSVTASRPATTPTSHSHSTATHTHHSSWTKTTTPPGAPTHMHTHTQTADPALLDPTDHKDAQRKAAWIVLIVGSLVLGVGIVLSRFPKGQTYPLPSFPHVHIPRRRKVYEGDDIMLVRWADEEMGVGNADEDTMVNGGDATNEYLPLRRDLNTRKGYGLF